MLTREEAALVDYDFGLCPNQTELQSKERASFLSCQAISCLGTAFRLRAYPCPTHYILRINPHVKLFSNCNRRSCYLLREAAEVPRELAGPGKLALLRHAAKQLAARWPVQVSRRIRSRRRRWARCQENLRCIEQAPATPVGDQRPGRGSSPIAAPADAAGHLREPGEGQGTSLSNAERSGGLSSVGSEASDVISLGHRPSKTHETLIIGLLG